MEDETAATFDSVMALHQHLVREADARPPESGLRPPLKALPDWIPGFERVPYRAVDPEALGLGRNDSFHELADERLDTAIRRVVDVEGPVHFRVMAERLLDAAGVGRLGSRIRERISARLDALERTEALVQRGSFIGTAGQFRMPQLRDWSALPDKLRDLDYVSDNELMVALFQAVFDEEGISAEQAMNDGIYRMGFIRLTNNARERLQAPLEALLEEDMLRQREEGLRLGWNAFLHQPVAASPATK